MKNNRERTLIIITFFTIALCIPIIDLCFFAQKQYEKVETIMVEVPIHVEKKVDNDFVPREVTEYDMALSNMNHEFEQIQNIESRLMWFIEYKDIVDKYSYIIDPPETIYDYFSDDEIYLVQRMVETETYQAPFEAKVNVANVALNRYYSEEFGDTLSKVITSPSQFAYSRKNISEDTILAVEYAFMMKDTTDGAIGFHSNSKTDRFNRWYYIFTDVVGHHFYGKEKN